MYDVQLLDSPDAAIAALKPMRAQLLAQLDAPRSAAELSKALGLPRQKVNYHLRVLESAGLIEVAEERRWGGLTERRMVASARAYIVSPTTLGPAAADPERSRDRLSATYLLALAARVLNEVGQLIVKARAQSKRLPTLSLDAEIRFRSAAERAAFTRELVANVTHLVGRYHDAGAAQGRSHRLVLVAHPIPSPAVQEPSP